MISYHLCAEESLKLRDMQVLLEVLKDRGIDARFEGFEQLKIGKPLPPI